MTATLACRACTAPLDYKGRGRPSKHCAPCRAEHTRGAAAERQRRHRGLAAARADLAGLSFAEDVAAYGGEVAVRLPGFDLFVKLNYPGQRLTRPAAPAKRPSGPAAIRNTLPEPLRGLYERYWRGNGITSPEYGDLDTAGLIVRNMYDGWLFGRKFIVTRGSAPMRRHDARMALQREGRHVDKNVNAIEGRLACARR